MKKIFLPITLTLLLFSCSVGQDNSTEKTNLTSTEFLAKIKEIDNPQILDVRTPGEFAGGHIENALNVDWTGSDFNNGIAKLDKTKPVLVYCLSGGRSSAAAKEMRKQGFEHVLELGKGMLGWRADKMPETKENSKADSASKAISLEDYKKLINNPDKLVLIDFYAEWCGPCKKMLPYMKTISASEKDKLVLIRIDADENPELCQALNVTALPTMKMYKDNKLVWDNLGLVSEEDLIAIIKKNY